MIDQVYLGVIMWIIQYGVAQGSLQQKTGKILAYGYYTQIQNIMISEYELIMPMNY